MANSLMIGSAKMGLHFVACGPERLHTDPAIVSKCKEIAKQSGATVEVTEDVDSALKDADAVYTDVWASMGEEDKLQERIALLKPYQVNAEMMKKTGKAETIFLHCLPAVKGNEVTEDVFESPASRVFEEAENRKHTIKAVMIATLL
jgi:ornithine carbamoyltransferase